MVTLKYAGTNLFVMGGYNKIPRYRFEPNKSVEVQDEHFWAFMQLKTFAYRVNNNIIIVPKEFPLENPKKIVSIFETKDDDLDKKKSKSTDSK